MDSRRGAANNQIARLEIFPKIVTLEHGGKHRLLVTAHFADGRAEDFTDQAAYKSNNSDVATISEDGIVRAERTGETAILVRAAGQAASATVGVIGPLSPTTLSHSASTSSTTLSSTSCGVTGSRRRHTALRPG